MISNLHELLIELERLNDSAKDCNSDDDGMCYMEGIEDNYFGSCVKHYVASMIDSIKLEHEERMKKIMGLV